MKRNQGNSNRNLAKRRRMVGLTQHNLAKESGVPVARITYAETGRLTLDDSELDKLDAVLRKRAAKAMDAVSA